MTLLSSNLRTFLAVKEHLTIAAAAKSLHITQAAVTLRIQGLERELDVMLFERSRRGMRLTQAGEALMRYCHRALEVEAEIMPNLKPGESSAATVHVILQGPSSPIRNRVMPALADYLGRFPFVTVESRISDIDAGIERLKNGSVDLLIAARSHISKEFDSKILKSERYILVAPTAWRSRTPEDIIATERIIDFDVTDAMTHEFLRKHNLYGLAKAERHFINLTECIADLVCRKVGYSVLSVETAGPLLEQKQLFNMFPAKFFDFQLGLAWYSRKQMPKYFEALIKMIK